VLGIVSQKVACLVIGTHSREIEGRLMRELLDAGWQLEFERPATLRIRRAGRE
jgi:hypothetical protein